MTTKKTTSVPFRRKRIGKTDYRKRLKLLQSQKYRLVIRKSLKHIMLQIVEFSPKGDLIIASAHSRELSKYGWKVFTKNLPACYLTGLLLAKKVKKKLECVLDMGNTTSVKGCLVYAAVQGAIDGGLVVPCSKEIVPSKDRLCGKHIAAWAVKIKADKAKYEKQFSHYLKISFDPEQLPVHFESVKKKILEAA